MTFKKFACLHIPTSLSIVTSRERHEQKTLIRLEPIKNVQRSNNVMVQAPGAVLYSTKTFYIPLEINYTLLTI